ncbi:MAG TPA: tRNA 2-thiouridine(34) synthase MnmA [Candidatus Paceibacterota bacterium]
MKVFVGLSGGVDSAVSAALLKEAGHDVTGVFIRIYRPEFIECTWKEDRLDAMRVCTALQIPFREIDLSNEYKKGVIDGMIADYAAGITPNPDVLCNRVIKFGAFLTWARKNGADKIATGHYAQITEHNGRYQLLRGKDSNKDQSYFLYRLMQDDLKHALFPIGHLTKPDVREQAKAFGLPVAQKEDSQGLCFVGDVSIDDFLRRSIDVTSGPVLNMQGTKIGEHHGAALITIGQRHGFAIFGSAAHAPHYVVAVDTRENSIIVSPNRSDAAVSGAMLRDVSWVEEAPQHGSHIEIQTRYRENPIQAMIVVDENNFAVRFSESHIATTGQSLVMYNKNMCIGGGIIEKTG